MYTNISVRRRTVAEGTFFLVFLGILDLLFLNNFFALDKASSAVLTFFGILGTGSTAAGTLGIILYQGTGDLFLRGGWSVKA